jgi:hypothetical protein
MTSLLIQCEPRTQGKIEWACYRFAIDRRGSGPDYGGLKHHTVEPEVSPNKPAMMQCRWFQSLLIDLARHSRFKI